jgi:outer membrane protein assembly factor BamB
MQCSGIFDVVALPLVENGTIFYKRPEDGHLAAATEGTRAEVWTYGFVSQPSLLNEGAIFTWAERDRLHLLDAATGQPKRIVACPTAQHAVVEGGLLLVLGYTQNGRILTAVDLSSGTECWRVSTGGRAKAFEGIFCVSEHRLVVGQGDTDLASPDQAVVAFSVADGRELWRQSVADLTWEDIGKLRPGRVDGTLIACGNVVLVNVVQHYVVGLSLEDGQRLWTWKAPHGAVWQGYLYDGRYYVIAGFGTYHVLDPKSGRLLFERDLRAALPEALRGSNPHSPLLVSETHTFTGSLGPHLLAFDRDSGEFSWSHKPAGAGDFQGQYFVSANGRFYYGDGALRRYCLEEIEPTDPVLAQQRQQQRGK